MIWILASVAVVDNIQDIVCVKSFRQFLNRPALKDVRIMYWTKPSTYVLFKDMCCKRNINISVCRHSDNKCAQTMLIVEPLFIKNQFLYSNIRLERALIGTNLWFKQILTLSMKSNCCLWKYSYMSKCTLVRKEATLPNTRVRFSTPPNRCVCTFLQKWVLAAQRNACRTLIFAEWT